MLVRRFVSVTTEVFFLVIALMLAAPFFLSVCLPLVALSP